MKEIYFSANGRKTYGEAFYDIENTAKANVEMFADANAFVLSGCEVTYSSPNLAIASGYIYLSGRVRYFGGGSIASTSGCLVALDTDYIAEYADGLTKKGGTDYTADFIVTTAITDLKDKIVASITVGIAKISDSWLAQYVVEKNPKSGEQTVVGKITLGALDAIEIESNNANLGYSKIEDLEVVNSIAFDGGGEIDKVAVSGATVIDTDTKQAVSGKALGDKLADVANALSYNEGRISSNTQDIAGNGMAISANITAINDITEALTWIEPTLNAGWGHSGQPFGYAKNAQGQVFIRGHVGRATGSDNRIFTLPEGFRPPDAVKFLVVKGVSGGVLVIHIYYTGQIYVGTATPGIDYKNGWFLTLSEQSFHV